MTERDLQKKMNEWLSLKREADVLEKALEDKKLPPESRAAFRDAKRGFSNHDELSAQMMPRAGVSVAGVEARRANPSDKFYMKLGGDLESHKRGALKQHKRIIEHIRSLKPNLPKSELEKIQSKPVNPKDPILNTAKFPPKALSEERKQQVQAKIMEYLKNKAAKSELDKSTDDPTAGIPIPPELHEHSGTVPHDHPHREIAAKFVTNVWRKDKQKGQAMSARYLGHDPSPQHASTATRYATIKAEKPQVIPADDSDPMIINTRATFANPKEINGPNIMNSYKSESSEVYAKKAISGIIKALKSKKGQI